MTPVTQMMNLIHFTAAIIVGLVLAWWREITTIIRIRTISHHAGYLRGVRTIDHPGPCEGRYQTLPDDEPFEAVGPCPVGSPVHYCFAAAVASRACNSLELGFGFALWAIIMSDGRTFSPK